MPDYAKANFFWRVCNFGGVFQKPQTALSRIPSYPCPVNLRARENTLQIKYNRNQQNRYFHLKSSMRDRC